MAEQEIDFNDAVISPVFVISAAVAVGIVDFTLFGFDFAEPIWEMSHGGDISVAKLFSIGAIIFALATNKPDFSAMGGVEMWTGLATIALVIAPPFVPMLDSLLGATIPALVALVIQAAGFYTLSYLG